MAQQTQKQLTLSIDRESLDLGSPEEKAAFGLLKITANTHPLTRLFDSIQNEYYDGPFVSGYHLAEWLTWNWWRLRWEPPLPPTAPDSDRAYSWALAHCLSTIGAGYVWPDVTISPDGYRSLLTSEPSPELDEFTFRYLGAGRETVPVAAQEEAIDSFTVQVLDWLTEARISDTNLHRLWRSLQTERANPELSRFRRLEARLGYDPDEIDEDEIKRCLADAALLGEEALEELADAHRGPGVADMMSAERIKEIAKKEGFDSNPADAAQLDSSADIPK